MAPNQLNRLLAVFASLVAAVGAIDALSAGQWDLAVLFLALVAVQAALLVRAHLRRPAVPLRADLVGWLGERALATGEPLEVLADRCISTYRSDVGDQP